MMGRLHSLNYRKSSCIYLVRQYSILKVIRTTNRTFHVLLYSIGFLFFSYKSNGQSEQKMNVYFISGLGADQRVFQKLTIDPEFNPVPIEWVKPGRKESMPSYARRLSTQIDTTKPFHLVCRLLLEKKKNMLASNDNDNIDVVTPICYNKLPIGEIVAKESRYYQV